MKLINTFSLALLLGFTLQACSPALQQTGIAEPLPHHRYQFSLSNGTK